MRKIAIVAVLAGFTLGALPARAAPDVVASKNIHAIMKGLKAAQFKYETFDDGPCAFETVCTVEVGDTQINAYGGGDVEILPSSKVPDARYVVVCAAALAGIAKVDTMAAASLVGEGLAKKSLKVGNVLLTMESRHDGKLSCALHRKV